MRNSRKAESPRTEVAPNADKAVIAWSASIPSQNMPRMHPKSAIDSDPPVRGLLRPGSRAGASGRHPDKQEERGQHVAGALTGRS